jgi:hypothetical protein
MNSLDFADSVMVIFHDYKNNGCLINKSLSCLNRLKPKLNTLNKTTHYFSKFNNNTAFNLIIVNKAQNICNVNMNQ